MRSRSTDPRRPRHADGGSVTAELALALPAVVLVLAVLLGVGQVLVARVSCIDAARAGARAAARAEPQARVHAIARSQAPAAAVEVSRDSDVVRVEAAWAVHVAVPGVAFPLRCVAVAVPEEL